MGASLRPPRAPAARPAPGATCGWPHPYPAQRDEFRRRAESLLRTPTPGGQDVLLEGRSAVIYGGGGSIGSAVARAFAREGARVFLAGRTRETLDAVAADIRAAGGAADTAQVDALDERAVDEHAAAVVADSGRLDISMNVIAHPYTHGVPMAEMSADDFMRPVEVAARTTFITARAAARHMIPQRSGVILAFGGPGDRSAPIRDYYLGGTRGRLRRDRDDPAA